MDSPRTGEGVNTAARREALERVAAADPASPALLDLARIYRDGGKPWLALEIAERIVAAHPYDLPAVLFNARLLAEQRQQEEARELLARHADLDLFGSLLQDLGALLTALGNSADASKAEAAARELSGFSREGEPVSPAESAGPAPAAEMMPTGTLAALYLAQGHREQAADVYERLAAMHPDVPEYRARLAELRAGSEPAQTEKDEAIGPSKASTAARTSWAPDLENIVEEMEPRLTPDSDMDPARAADMELERIAAPGLPIGDDERFDDWTKADDFDTVMEPFAADDGQGVQTVETIQTEAFLPEETAMGHIGDEDGVVDLDDFLPPEDALSAQPEPEASDSGDEPPAVDLDEFWESLEPPEQVFKPVQTDDRETAPAPHDAWLTGKDVETADAASGQGGQEPSDDFEVPELGLDVDFGDITAFGVDDEPAETGAVVLDDFAEPSEAVFKPVETGKTEAPLPVDEAFERPEPAEEYLTLDDVLMPAEEVLQVEGEPEGGGVQTAGEPVETGAVVLDDFAEPSEAVFKPVETGKTEAPLPVDEAFERPEPAEEYLTLDDVLMPAEEVLRVEGEPESGGVQTAGEPGLEPESGQQDAGKLQMVRRLEKLRAAARRRREALEESAPGRRNDI